jgi:hypothetical protein
MEEQKLKCEYCGEVIDFTDEPPDCSACGQNHWLEVYE